MPDNLTEKKTPMSDSGIPQGVKEVLDDIKTKIDGMEKPSSQDKPAPQTVPSYQDRREELKKRLNFNEEQMRAHEELLAEQQAPILEQSGWTRLERHADLSDLKKEIEDELRLYPTRMRNPEVMEKIYYMVKGRKIDSRPPISKDSSSNVRSRVTSGPGFSASEPSLPAGGDREGRSEEQLSDVEKLIASKFGVDEKSYAQAKKDRREFRGFKPAEISSSSRADSELKRLMSR